MWRCCSRSSASGVCGAASRRCSTDLVAPQALRRYLENGPRDLRLPLPAAGGRRLRGLFTGVGAGVHLFLDDGPVRHPQFAMLAGDIGRLCAGDDGDLAGRSGQAALRGLIDRLRGYFLAGRSAARQNFTWAPASRRPERHRRRVAAASSDSRSMAPAVAEAVRGFRRDLNVVMSRGVWRVFGVALQQYQSTLDRHALVDFSGVLERAVRLLKEMDEFAQSRYRLETRYSHVLVDEFQDTSRAQWHLVAQLVKSWGEGWCRRRRDAAVDLRRRSKASLRLPGRRCGIADEAGTFIEQLGPRAIPPRHHGQFPATPALLAFVNDVSGRSSRRET